MSIKEDYERFRSLVQKEVRYRLRHHPVILAQDWVIRCYFSPKAFEEEFPNPYARGEYLQELQNRRQAFSYIRERLDSMIKNMPWNDQQQNTID